MEKYKILSIEVDGKVYDLREEDKEVITVEQLNTISVDRTCTRCNQKKKNDCFYGDATKPNGLSLWCKDCKKEYSKIYTKNAQKRKEKREYMRKYNQMRKEQKINAEQNLKPDIGVIDGTIPDAIPVTPLSSVDEKAVDSVIGDPEKRKRFHW